MSLKTENGKLTGCECDLCGELVQEFYDAPIAGVGSWAHGCLNCSKRLRTAAGTRHEITNGRMRTTERFGKQVER